MTRKIEIAGVLPQGVASGGEGTPRTVRVMVAATVAVALSAGLLPQASAADRPIDAATRRAIDDAVAANRKTYGGTTPAPGVIVGVWDGSGHSYVRGYGVADLETKRPLAAADSVRIGSITKTFVADLLLQLADEGKLNLDDPVAKFDIGVTVPNGDRLTLRELAQMRSGLPEFFDGPEADLVRLKLASKADLRAMLATAFQKRPAHAPGSAYEYCNTNYLILGLVVESVTHRDIGDEIRARILSPEGLKHTLYPAGQDMPEPWAHGYDRKQGRWVDVGGSMPVSVSGAAGAMTSDAGDMAAWIRRFVTGRSGFADMPQSRLDCLPTGIGNISFGLGVVCSAGWYGYTGGMPGYNSAAYYSPAMRTTVVVFVTTLVDEPLPGVANATFSDIAAILTPKNRPLDIGPARAATPRHGK